MSRSSSLPERPTNGSPARSSSRPGTLADEEQVGCRDRPHRRRPGSAPRPAGSGCSVDAVDAQRLQDVGAGITRPERRVGAVDQDPGHARADATHHLVADRPQHGRPVVGRDDLVALAAEEHDLVAGAHRVVVAAVDDDLVHGHHAGQRPARPADEDLVAGAERARAAPRRRSRWAPWPPPSAPAAVAAGRRRGAPRPRGAHGDHPRLERHGRDAGARPPPAPRRPAAARGHPAGTRRGRGRSAPCRSATRGKATAPAVLAACTHGGADAPGGQVRHREGGRRGRAGPRCRRGPRPPRRRPPAGGSRGPRAAAPARPTTGGHDRRQVRGRGADPVHAGVDLQVHRPRDRPRPAPPPRRPRSPSRE